MKTSDNITEIAAALCKFQSALQTIKTEQVNPYYKSKYSDLASIWSMIRKPLTDNGFSVIQEATTTEIGVNVTTLIMHTSGQYIETGPLTVFFGKRDPHSVGSATSYGKRYALCASLSIVTGDEDDDGNRAQQGGEAKLPSVDMIAFKDQWLATYPELNEYLAARAKYKKHSVNNTIIECAQDLELFQKNIETWLKKKHDQETKNALD